MKLDIRHDLPNSEQISAELAREKYKRRYKRIIRSTIYSLIIVAAVAVLIATLLMPVLQVSGTSMEPTLNNGEIIALMKTDNYSTGDLCGFYWQNRLLLKRVIATEGSYVDIDSTGNVYVDGKLLDEPYVSEKSLGECDISFPYQVEDGKVFVMGDHRSTSVDSRSSVIGTIAKDQIVGRVMFRVWPFDKISWLG